MECENDKIAGGVSQDSGTTAEELVERRDGKYADKVFDSRDARSNVKERANTVNPFAGVK